MKELNIIEKKGNVFLLKESTQQDDFVYIMELYNVPKLSKKDKMLIDEKLINRSSKNFVQPLCFELDESVGSQFMTQKLHKDYAVLIANNKKFIMKRIYG